MFCDIVFIFLEMPDESGWQELEWDDYIYKRILINR